MAKLIFVIFILILAGIGFSVFISPEYAKMKAIEAELVQLEADALVADNLKQSRTILENQRSQITNQNIERTEKLLPDSPDNIRLIIQIDEIAKRNGLTTLRAIAYDSKGQPRAGTQAVNSSAYDSYEVTFETVGQYRQFVSFIKEVETNLRIVDIISVDLAPETSAFTAGQGTSDLQRFKVTLKAYWLTL
jgi:Tfp pilus assembly protein PilO